jgi:hypothetical protein
MGWILAITLGPLAVAFVIRCGLKLGFKSDRRSSRAP